jgi:hypothetical protein
MSTIDAHNSDMIKNLFLNDDAKIIIRGVITCYISNKRQIQVNATRIIPLCHRLFHLSSNSKKIIYKLNG